MKSEREHNYDVLRVVSAMAVIMVHVSALWINVFSAHIAAGGDLEELQHASTIHFPDFRCHAL